jgi:hypothetical protein
MPVEHTRVVERGCYLRKGVPVAHYEGLVRSIGNRRQAKEALHRVSAKQQPVLVRVRRVRRGVTLPHHPTRHKYASSGQVLQQLVELGHTEKAVIVHFQNVSRFVPKRKFKR